MSTSWDLQYCEFDDREVSPQRALAVHSCAGGDLQSCLLSVVCIKYSEKQTGIACKVKYLTTNENV